MTTSRPGKSGLAAGLAITLACVLLAPAAATGANIVDNKHLGVASCATSVCHGKLAPQPDRRVALNEYRVWTQDDRHSMAYRTLELPASKAIAQKLGLPSATAAKICLDCHADNVPAAKRGPKFQVSDGVGCEACHGGAEDWIQSHAERSATHKANVAQGMYANDVPLRRAELCLSCHLGTADRFATHAIMGAGHPRLSFELESFTANQPAHYQVDADYIQRKGKPEGMNLWLAGQLASAGRYLSLLDARLGRPGALFPELAFYDCHSCHHPMDDVRWTASRAGPGVAPGSLRLQRQHLVMLEAAADAIGDAGGARQMADGRAALMRAGHTDAALVRTATSQLAAWVKSRESWTTRSFARPQVVALRRSLLRYAADDRASDFSTAEQVVLGVESLSYSLGDRERLKGPLDLLYNAVKNGSSFSPRQFADAAKRVQSQF